MLALAASLAGAGAILVTWALVRVATIDGYRASLPVSASLRIADTDEATLRRVLAALRDRPEVAGGRARRVVAAAVQGQGPWRSALLIGVDSDDPAFGREGLGVLRSEVGPWPPPLGTLAVERSSFEFASATLGEAQLVRGGAATNATSDSAKGAEGTSAPASAIVRDVSLAPGWMEHLVVAFATRQTLAALGLGDGFNELQVRFRSDDKASTTHDAMRQRAATLRGWLEAQGLRVESLDVPRPGEHIHAGQMNSLLMTQGAFGALALVVSAVLVINLVGALLAAQSRQLAVMKVLGASPSALAALHLTQAAVLGAAASLIALPTAALLGRRYAALKAELLNFPLDDISTPAWSLALLLVVGVVVPVVAAWFPIRRACRTPVADALRDIGIVEPGAPLVARRLLGVSRWPRPLALALGNAFRRRRRLVLTLAALAVGGAVLLAADNLRRAVVASVDLLFEAQRYDLTLRLAAPQAASAAEAAALAVGGVSAAEGWRGARAQRVGEGGALLETVRVVGLPRDSLRLRPKLLAGQWIAGPGAAAPDGEAPPLVLSRTLARDHPDLQPGSVVRLAINGGVSEWRVAGIVDSGTQPLAYAARAALNRVMAGSATPAVAASAVSAASAGSASAEVDDRASTLVIAMEPRSPAGQLDVTLRLRQAMAEAGIPVAASQLQAEQRRVIEDHLLMVVDFLGVMGWVMMAVGGLALASTMGLAVLERSREIGVLRAIGAGHGSILLLVQAEGLIVTVLAWLACLPLSLPISLLLGEAFGRVMFAVGTVWWPEPLAALRWLALMLALSLLACAVPAWRAMRVPAGRVLAYG